jgi:hypothetical protein
MKTIRQKTDVEEPGLKRQVRSVKTVGYNARKIFGKIIKGRMYFNKSCLYDTNGNLINKHEYNSSYGFKNWTYKYDSNGNWIERCYSHCCNHDDDLLVKYTCKCKYDSDGNRIELNEYDSCGCLEKRQIYKYDSNGNEIEWHEYNSKGSLVFKHTYKYDSKGNMIENNGYDSRFNWHDKKTYKYDSNGNLIEESYSDGSPSYTCKYDSNGNQIERNEYEPDGRLRNKWTYKYDSNGNMIEEKCDIRFWSKQIYEYKYDSKGNRITIIYEEKKTNSVRKASSIIEKQITYYE